MLNIIILQLTINHWYEMGLAVSEKNIWIALWVYLANFFSALDSQYEETKHSDWGAVAMETATVLWIWVKGPHGWEGYGGRRSQIVSTDTGTQPEQFKPQFTAICNKYPATCTLCFIYLLISNSLFR